MPTFKEFHKEIINEKKAAERAGSEHSKLDKIIKSEEKRKQRLIHSKDKINAQLRATPTTETTKIAEYNNLLTAADVEIAAIDMAVANLVAMKSTKYNEKDTHARTKEHTQFVRNNEEQIQNRKINAVHKGYRAYLEDVPTKARRIFTATLVSLGLLGVLGSNIGKLKKHKADTEVSPGGYKDIPSGQGDYLDDQKDKNNNNVAYDTAKAAVTPDTLYMDQQGKIIQNPNSKTSKNLNKKNNLDGGPEYTGPKIDNFEFYSAEEAYRLHNADSTLAMKNYNKGFNFFAYHEVKEEFKGINSSFWRQRNVELGRDAYDYRNPLRPGEKIESLKFDNLVVSKFSVKDGLEYARLVIIKKGTMVIVDASGKVVATAECDNPWIVNHTICPPNTPAGSTYGNG